MKKNILYLFLLCIPHALYAKVILVDNTVLFQQASVSRLTRKLFDGISAWKLPGLLAKAPSLEKNFFKFLKRLPAPGTSLRNEQGQPHLILYHGKPVPALMQKWTLNQVHRF